MHCLASVLLIGSLLSGGNLISNSDIPLSHYMTFHLTWLYIQTGQPDTARHLLDTLDTESVPQDANATFWYEERARLYALLYDYDAALADVNRALDIAKEFNVSSSHLADLYTHRGEVYLLLYEWDAALSNFNQALELSPDHADAHFQRGVLYYTMAQRDDALQDFQQYVQLAPDGRYSEQATTYIDSIQTEIEALNPRQN